MRTKIEYSIELKDVPREAKEKISSISEDLEGLSKYCYAIAEDLEGHRFDKLIEATFILLFKLFFFGLCCLLRWRSLFTSLLE